MNILTWFELLAAIDKNLQFEVKGAYDGATNWDSVTNIKSWSFGDIYSAIDEQRLRTKPEAVTLYEQVNRGATLWTLSDNPATVFDTPSYTLTYTPTGRVIRNGVIEEAE